MATPDSLWAHEIGHVIGISGHPPGDPLMGPTRPFRADLAPVTREAMRILFFELRPGDPIPAA